MKDQYGVSEVIELFLYQAFQDSIYGHHNFR